MGQLSWLPGCLSLPLIHLHPRLLGDGLSQARTCWRKVKNCLLWTWSSLPPPSPVSIRACLQTALLVEWFSLTPEASFSSSWFQAFSCELCLRWGLRFSSDSMSPHHNFGRLEALMVKFQFRTRDRKHTRISTDVFGCLKRACIPLKSRGDRNNQYLSSWYFVLCVFQALCHVLGKSTKQRDPPLVKMTF